MSAKVRINAKYKFRSSVGVRIPLNSDNKVTKIVFVFHWIVIIKFTKIDNVLSERYQSQVYRRDFNSLLGQRPILSHCTLSLRWSVLLISNLLHLFYISPVKWEKNEETGIK